ncbi:TPA: helix-turn-helix transcriptional regulator [Streptococcus agalactiae]|uniref:DeoR faimly transcriptional regulator n=3 Tax=Streptococcus TaxID=1301 RepID=A0AAW3HPC5_STRAG|nr:MULTISPECIES: YafY family protein [Streptococcus]VMQ02611.1 DNA-bind protein [Streptococcus pneumoniae]HES7304326.1 YafY family transcriptional regulator [Streptococcus pyogenes]ANW85375.1 Transcriptional regulator, DeoR family [Streptococcus anginosus]EMA8754034.1 YafY family transcriptional regulator [Streptococcus agalactiae]EPT44753.1 DeoR faimly transcriptional regulator [Streptococcus agalactiae FSL S3-337]
MKNNRLFKILYYVLEKGKVTANELAEKYEVSIRTIYRDIDVLSSAGIPIYATQGKGGGIEIADDFVLKKSFLSENEQEQILIALKGLELTNKEYENELLTKLTALFKTKNTNWIEVDFTNWQRSKSYDELFKDIKSAIINKNIVSFTYFSSNKKETSREVKPIRLLFKGWDWYVYAFCLSRNDFRYFKLSRIKEFEILSNTFEDDFDNIVLKKEMEYEETVFVKVKFDRKMAFRVYDEVSSAIEEDEDGNLYATVELPNNYNLYNYIFSYGDAAEVLEPKEIRDKIKNIINFMDKKYKYDI